jgi:protein gp37
MSDLFHKDVPDEYIRSVFNVMVEADWHIFQVLTKRSARLARMGSSILWPPHIWVSVSIESNSYIWRADQLRNEVEPLLTLLVILQQHFCGRMEGKQEQGGRDGRVSLNRRAAQMGRSVRRSARAVSPVF